MQIEELHTLTDTQAKELQVLMKELTSRVSVSVEMLERAVASSNTHLFAMADDGHIIGCASLCVFESPTGRKASVEDVVVLSSYRSQKLGKKLMDYVIEYAKKELSPVDIHLTSNPKRVSANSLYKAVGFEQRYTNAYAMVIK